METSHSFLFLLSKLYEAIHDESLLQKVFEERDDDRTEIQGEIETPLEVEPSPVLMPENIFQRTIEKQMLLDKLFDPDEERIQLSVTPILGSGGIGKTTFARMVYEDEVVKKHFELRIWVEVPGQEFRLHVVAKELLKSAVGISCPLNDLDELDDMVRDTLQSQRCLIVFDQIEFMTEESWLHMKQFWFYVVGLGSKVVITTPSKDFVNLIARQPFELSELSHDDGWSLCGYIAFDSSRGKKDEFSILAKNLAFLCRGIPLLLKLMGSLMRHEERLSNLLSYVNLSDGNLVPLWDESVVILLSIWALPHHLRQCFLFCTVFPHSYALNKDKIIEMWIAHGLVKPSSRNNNLEDIGDAYVRQLLCRSCFMDITCDDNGAITEFQMPRLIYKIAEYVARIVCKEKGGVIDSIDENAGKLSLVLPFAEEYRSAHFGTLVLSSTIYLDGILDRSLVDFRGLKSLDLSCSGIRNLSDDISALKELRYLNLSYTLLERLPDPITELSRLQTLDLAGCYHLNVLPQQMRALIDLRHLDLSLCDSLSALPSGIGFLRSLSLMPLFVLGKDHGCTRLEELGSLNQLRGRLEIRHLENVQRISEAQDAKLNQKNLHHLGLSWSHIDANGYFQVLEYLQPNKQLKVLDINGYMGSKFPSWMSFMQSLIKISINTCGSEELPSLGQLPLLKELQLKGMRNIAVIGQAFYGYGVDDAFLSLEQLGFYDMPRLVKWSVPSHATFPSLKTLTVQGCGRLKLLPSIPTLFDLIVWNCQSKILCHLISFISLSSLVVSGVELGTSLQYYISFNSLKKLILFNIEDKHISHLGEFAVLEHLGIQHCRQLLGIGFLSFRVLQKLHIIDCPKLQVVEVGRRIFPLMELVIEDCPLTRYIREFPYSIKKLTIRSCPELDIVFEELEELEYMFISGCPQLERWLETDPAVISHVPCVILGNRKVEQPKNKDSKDFVELKSKESASEKQLSPVMSGVYNNWERLVEAVLKREELKRISRCESFSSSISADFSSRYNFVSSLEDVSGSKISSDNIDPGAPLSKSSISYREAKHIEYKEIKKATKNFRRDLIIGEGGFGTIFKGWIDEQNLTAAKPGSGMAVAVKKWRKNSGQGREEWMKEIHYLSQLHHPNVVRLIGYCDKEENMILVYEFMPKGSLHNHLFGRGHQSLPWETRIKVAIGAARGLSFLHDREIQVIHRSFKCGDILLDGEFTAKLSDFGVARDGPTGGRTHVSTRVMGTIGYIAPEYYMTGCLTAKCDVYGYGVVLLEILSGRRVTDWNRPTEEQTLVESVKSYISDKRKLLRIMDATLEGKYPREAAYTVATLASRCLSVDPKERPRMAEVLVALEKL